MNIGQKVAAGVGGLVLAVGAYTGVHAVQQSQTTSASQPISSVAGAQAPGGQSGTTQNGSQRNQAPGTQTGQSGQAGSAGQAGQTGQAGQAAQGQVPTQLAASLAKALGVSESKVTAALQTAMQSLQSSTSTTTQPTMDQMDAKLAPLLAKSLGVDEAKVLAALQASHPTGAAAGNAQSGTAQSGTRQSGTASPGGTGQSQTTTTGS